MLISVGIIGVWYFTKPKTIHEVFADFDEKTLNFKTYKPGDEVAVSGKITKIELHNTTVGVFKILLLDNIASPKGIIVGNTSRHRVGEKFTSTLHFASYTYNGAAIASARELFFPLPAIPLGIGRVLSGVSVVRANLRMEPSNDIGGIALETFRYISGPEGMVSTSALNASLFKLFSHGMAEIYELQGLSDSANFIDRMDLGTGSSLHGIMSFADVNLTGGFDTGDRLLLRVPQPQGAAEYCSYCLALKLKNGREFFTRYLAIGPGGLTEYLDEPPRLQYRLASDEPSGEGRRLTFLVTDLSGTAGQPRGISVSGLRAVLYEGSTGKMLYDSRLSVSFLDRVHLSDSDGDGLVDAGDEIVVENTVPLKGYKLWLYSGETGVLYASFIPSLGLSASDIPYTISLALNRSVPGNATLNVTELCGPAGIFLNSGSFKVYLEDTITRNCSWDIIATGPAGNVSGVFLEFTDATSNGYFNAGDRFTVLGGAGKPLCVKILYDNRVLCRVDWTG